MQNESKRAPNCAGRTVFADPDYVEGTLRQGFGYYRSLEWNSMIQFVSHVFPTSGE